MGIGTLRDLPATALRRSRDSTRKGLIAVVLLALVGALDGCVSAPGYSYTPGVGGRPYTIREFLPDSVPYDPSTTQVKRILVLVNNSAYKANRAEFERELIRQNEEVARGIRATVLVRHNEFPELAPRLESEIQAQCIAKGLEVVERRNLKTIVDEIDLQHTALIDPQTACHYGKLLGADTVLLVDITECEMTGCVRYIVVLGRGYQFQSEDHISRATAVFRVIRVGDSRILLAPTLVYRAVLRVVGLQNLGRTQREGFDPEDQLRREENDYRAIVGAFMGVFGPARQ